MAQWFSHDHFFKRRHLWAFVSHTPAAQQVAGLVGLVGLYRLGNFVSLEPARSKVGCPVLQRGGTVSLFGVLVFWFEPVFLGLDVFLPSHHLVQRAVQRALDLSHRGFNCVHRLSQLQPTHF